MWCEGVEPAGHPIVEPGTQRDQQVGLLQRGDRRDGAVHAGHSQVLAVGIRERATGHQGGDQWDAGQLGQPQQLRGRAGLEHSTTNVEHRSLSAGDQLRGLPDLLAVRLDDRPVTGQVQGRRPVEPGWVLQHVFRDVDQHRAGTSGVREVKRLRNGLRDLIGVLDQKVVFGDRQGDPGDVGLLKGIGADRGEGHLAGDRDQRHRVQEGIRDRRDQVRRTGSRGCHADTYPAGDLGVALGGVTGALLVADQYVPDPDGVIERVVCGQNRAAGNAKYHVRADLFERADQ